MYEDGVVFWGLGVVLMGQERAIEQSQNLRRKTSGVLEREISNQTLSTSSSSSSLEYSSYYNLLLKDSLNEEDTQS
ncbi:hypothetical protein CROQUDRAFT_93085 [Cronartium quercuum f. sp. fusiforme G11]|uniref:Uncharacterized protein n=1 Tax=Cronartium quercuum f. sp. fusiforme G11 TaxID=708437 RepID=A0A9P6TBA0_9BASI|nr:hypothetical protein CROQUDRAFT_93085 [Cronartium quercuum f. sp. fusiforme G11]